MKLITFFVKLDHSFLSCLKKIKGRKCINNEAESSIYSPQESEPLSFQKLFRGQIYLKNYLFFNVNIKNIYQAAKNKHET